MPARDTADHTPGYPHPLPDDAERVAIAAPLQHRIRAKLVEGGLIGPERLILEALQELLNR